MKLAPASGIRAPVGRTAVGTRKWSIRGASAWLAWALADPIRGAALLALLTAVIYGATFAVGTYVMGRSVQSGQVHYAHLADAFLNGRLDVDPAAAATPLSELVPYEGKHYVVYPPMPAVLLMPVVAAFGPDFPTSLASIVLASCAIGFAYVMLRRLAFPWPVSAAVAILFAFGTAFWWTALRGSSWLLAHIVAVMFLSWALVELFGDRRRPWLIGILLGAAILSRLPVVMTVPFFIAYAVHDRPQKLNRALQLLAGVGLFVGANMLYNFARYGTILDVGYVLIPGVLDEPWYAEGIIHWSYVPRNLHLMLFQPPILTAAFPYFVPTTFGLSLFLATPAFFLILLAPARRVWTWILVATALAAMMPGLLHGWPGGGQFGYRFSLDAMPFLLILIALGMRGRVTPRAALLVGLSVLSSVWGLVYLRRIVPYWIFPLEGWTNF